MRDLYDRTLRVTLAFPRVTIGVFAVTTALAVYLGVTIPKGFLPTEDVGSLFAFTEGAQDISYDAMYQQQQLAVAKIRENPHVASTMSYIGVGGSSQQMNLGRIVIMLKPRSERPSADKVMQELRPALAEIPGLKVFLQNLPSIRLGGTITKSQFQFTLQSADLDELYHWAPIIEERVRTIPGFQDVTSDLQIKNTQVDIAIDRDKAAALRLDPEQIQNALYNAFGSRQVSTIYTQSNEYWVILEVAPQYQRDASALSLLYVRGGGGNLVPTRLGGAHRHLDRTAVHQSPGAAARGHHLLQPGARDGLGRGGQPGERRTGGGACAGHAELQLPGSGAGLPVLAGRACRCCC